MPVPFVAAGGAILAGLVAAFGRLFSSKLGVWIASAMAVLGLQFIATEALVEPILNQLQSMAGGIGGFALAAGMGAIKQSTGSYQLALWLFASLGVLAWFGLHGVKRRWRTTWGSAAVTAARV